MGDVSVKNSTFDKNAAGNSLIETIGAVIVENSTLNSNTATDKIINAHDAGSSVTVTNSTISNNTAGSSVIYGNDKVFVADSALNNNGGTAAVAGGNVAILSTTIADTEGTGTVKVDAGNNAYILNSTIADKSDDAGSLVEADGTAYIHNSIVVSNDDTAKVVDGAYEAAYSIMSNKGSGNYVTSYYSYDKAFADHKISADGMLVPVDTIAERRGSFTMYSVNEDGTLNVSYSDRYNNDVISTGNYYNPLVDQAWTVMTDKAPEKGKVIRYTPGVQYFTMPGVGAYWSGNYSVDYGPGLNTDYFDPSFNGELDYYGKNNFRTTVSALPAGLMDDDRRAMPSVDEFDSSINSGITSGFRVTERADIGEMLTSEEYISETVNAPQDELDGEYYMTPTTADGVPVAPETAAEADEAEEADALEETLAEITDSIGETVEKVASLFKHADVFKDDFDKALEELLDIKA